MTRGIASALASSKGFFLSGVVASSLLGLGFLGVGGSSHTVTAQFRDADGLVVGNEVRVAGVAAGSVTSVEVKSDASNGQQFAQVDMTIDANQWPLRQGTTVAVKPKGVLSNVFVELDPGSPHNPSLGDHPFFPLNQTRSPVSLQELNNVFTSDVRESIRTQLQEGVLAFGGAGATDLNSTLINANPLTLDAITLTDVLATRSPQLDALNFEFDTISGDLAREDSNLRPLISNLDTTMNAIAVQQAALKGTLDHAGSVFGDLTQALSSPTTQADLQRIFEQGPESLACATSIASYITPLVTAVNPYISYKKPYSLDSLLADFVTGTGFTNDPGSWGGTTTAHADSLRADLFVPQQFPSFSTYASADHGGLTLSHNGYTNTTLNGKPVYEEQPPLTGPSSHPTLNGCAPPAGFLP
jgi:ABC-type transporter Mla subunit MlaD